MFPPPGWAKAGYRDDVRDAFTVRPYDIDSTLGRHLLGLIWATGHGAVIAVNAPRGDSCSPP